MEPYYYQKMSKEEKKAYTAMKYGLTNLADQFSVPKLEGYILSDIFFKLRLDCPEIFYAVTFKYKFYADSEDVVMIPEYLFDKNKIRDHQKAMKARVEKLARQCTAKTEWDKEKYIHDFIVQNVHYDKLKKPYSHEIIGPLGHGVGVCEGIAKSVKILCDTLGIWCMIAISEANPEKGIKYRHAWNIVKINGIYYHLDATFDNSISQNEIRYDYFNLSDAQLFRDHEPVISKVPECNEKGHFYYLEKKLSFTKYEDIRKRTLQAAKKGKTFIFHWRGGYLTKDVLKELVEIIHETAAEKNKSARIFLNHAQAVLMIQYISEETKHELIFDEANEGEKC